MLFTKAGWDPVSVHALLGEVRQQVKDPKMHSFTNVYVTPIPSCLYT
jgi:hypothetical protein